MRLPRFVLKPHRIPLSGSQKADLERFGLWVSRSFLPKGKHHVFGSDLSPELWQIHSQTEHLSQFLAKRHCGDGLGSLLGKILEMFEGTDNDKPAGVWVNSRSRGRLSFQPRRLAHPNGGPD